MTTQTETTQTEQENNVFFNLLKVQVAEQIKTGIAKATKKANFDNLNLSFEDLQDSEIIDLIHSERVEKVTIQDAKTTIKLNRQNALFFCENLSKLPSGTIEIALSRIVAMTEKENKYFFLYAFENRIKAVLEEEKNTILNALCGNEPLAL